MLALGKYYDIDKSYQNFVGSNNLIFYDIGFKKNNMKAIRNILGDGIINYV